MDYDRNLIEVRIRNPNERALLCSWWSLWGWYEQRKDVCISTIEKFKSILKAIKVR
jgi:hypothetical protein